MKVFILEDEIYKYRAPIKQILEAKGHTLHIATNVADAKQMFTGDYDLLLLDHDMNGVIDSSELPNCGYQFVLWFLQQPLKGSRKPPVVVHSQNHSGARKMVMELESAGFIANHYYYSYSYLKWLESVADYPVFDMKVA